VKFFAKSASNYLCNLANNNKYERKQINKRRASLWHKW